MLEKILNIIGEDNEKRLRDGITDIILGEISNDFEEYSRLNYLIEPSEVEEYLQSCKDEAMRNLRREVVKKFEDELRAKLEKLEGEK